MMPTLEFSQMRAVSKAAICSHFVKGAVVSNSSSPALIAVRQGGAKRYHPPAEAANVATASRQSIEATRAQAKRFMTHALHHFPGHRSAGREGSQDLKRGGVGW